VTPSCLPRFIIPLAGPSLKCWRSVGMRPLVPLQAIVANLAYSHALMAARVERIAGASSAAISRVAAMEGRAT